MRAVVCEELGPPSSLVIGERPDPPPPGPGFVTIAVEAAGVNYVDALFVQGQYQIKPRLPFVPGSEVAGTIAAVGDGVTGLAVGDRVLASCGLGGFAEQVTVAADAAVPLPGELDAARAATFTQSYATALFSLRDRARLAPDEIVLVLGAGGGIGLATIDVARALGARTIAAASSAGKRDAAVAAGAAAVIDTSTESVKIRARELASEIAGRPVTGVDVVMDPVGGELAEEALRAIGEGGRYLVVGFASGTIPSLPLNQVLLRNRTLLGVDWGAWAMAHPAPQAALLRDLLGWVHEGRLQPTAPTTYPLARTAEALDDLLARRVVGKLALVP
jgi:NADPH2:quinone reductase